MLLAECNNPTRINQQQHFNILHQYENNWEAAKLNHTYTILNISSNLSA